MQKKMKNEGITLIALVISIIVMLILAGVSVGMLIGEKGLLGRAQMAVRNYSSASEMESLSLSVLNYEATNNEADRLGEKLSKKDVSNPDWHMIQDGENTYADGWYFIKQGDALPNGSKAKSNYVINYETGEVKELKEQYASLSLGDSVAVKDGLVLNIDTAMMDKKEGNWTTDEIEKALGDNVKLNGFSDEDLGTKSGFNSEGFLFDGEDDYISITNNTILDDLFNKGFTFEFSGICEGSFRDFDTISDQFIEENCAMFSIESPNLNKESPLAVSKRPGSVFIKIAGDNAFYSRWSNTTYGMDTLIPYDIKRNEPITFSLVLDLSKTGEESNVKNEEYTGYKLSLYIDGKEEMSSYLNMNQWTKFKENYMGKTNTFDLGGYRNYYTNEGDSAYEYARMILKNCRFYTRPLSAEEIRLNYNTRLAYDEANN